MSINFWVDLGVAIGVLGLGIFLVRSYKRGLIRTLRARWMRRKIVSNLNMLLPLIAKMQEQDSPAQYNTFRYRAELEALMLRSRPLFDEERARLADFLARLAAAFARSEAGTLSEREMTDLILLGQRTIHEANELGH